MDLVRDNILTKEWWMFALAGFVTAVIALATVGVQALKGAMSNPVEGLRSEQAAAKSITLKAPKT